MEINVLGPPSLSVDGTKRKLGPKLGALLTALVLTGRRPLGGDPLVQMLTHGEVTPAQRVTLRTHVKNLRNALLASGSSTQVVYSDSGYLISASPNDEIDVFRFRDLVAGSRQAARNMNPEAANRQARQALSLWRDSPGADLTVIGHVADELDRLIALRREAVELRLRSDLDLGRHETVLSEVRSWVLEYPKSAELWRLWILAAYRCGRRNEALDVFKSGKRRLQDEAVDHGPLEKIAIQVRAEDSHLDWVAPSRPVQRGPVSIPRDVASFVGRTREIRKLTELVEQADAAAEPLVINVYGMPGIGKTAVTTRVANLIAGSFDVVLSTRLETYGTSPYDPMQALTGFLRLLEQGAEAPIDREAGMARLSTLLAERRTLVVIDDAGDAAQVETLIPGGARHVVIVTSRTALSDLDGAVGVRLDVLDDADSLALMEKFVPAARLAADARATQKLIDYCAGMPLALRIVGALLSRYATWQIAAFHEWLIADVPLGRLRTGTDRDVFVSIHRSYVTFPAEQARLVHVLGVLGVDELSVEIVAAALDAPANEAERLLFGLETAQLLESPSYLRYRIHHIVKEFAKRLHDDAGESPEPVIGRVLKRYLRRTAAASAAIFETGEPQTTDVEFGSASEAGEWLTAEIRNLTTLAQQPETVLHPDGARFAIDLNLHLRRWFDLRSRWDYWKIAATAAMDAARRSEDDQACGYALRDLGIVAARRGEFAQATRVLDEASELLNRVGDRFGEAAVTNNLALIHLLSGDPGRAIAPLQRAIELFSDLDPTVVPTTMMNLGEAHRRNGEPEQALDLFEQALQQCRKTHNLVDEGKSLHNLGEVHREMGHPALARDYYEQSETVFNRSGDEHTRALTLYGLGALAEQDGDVRAARDYMERAASILRDLESDDLRDVAAHLARLPIR